MFVLKTKDNNNECCKRKDLRTCVKKEKMNKKATHKRKNTTPKSLKKQF